MKRAVLAVLAGLVLVAAAPAADRFLIAAAGSYLRPSDPGFREIYGAGVFAPGAWAGVRVVKGLHAFAGYEWSTKHGTTPELGLEAKSTQRAIWAGLGYVVRVADLVQFKVEAGGASIGYTEEAMELTISGSALGFRAGAGFLFLSRVLFTEFSLGYLGASDTVEDVPIKLGGFKATLCVGVRL